MKFRVYARTNKVGSECEDEFEVDDSELEGMTDAEIEAHVESIAQDVAFNSIDWGFNRIDH